jgi:hypothetical protein
LFKQIVIPQQSAQAVRRFFDSEKVEAYFDRAKPVKWELVISVEVGALIAELYAKDHMFVADDPQVRLIKALQLVDGCGNADEDPSDDDRGEGGVGPHYAATISSRATFLQVASRGDHVAVQRNLCHSSLDAHAYDAEACGTVRANRCRQWIRISQMHHAGLVVVRGCRRRFRANPRNSILCNLDSPRQR